MTHGVLVSWAVAFVLTQLIEMPIYVLGLRVRPWTAFGASAITHPIVWFVIPPVFHALWATLGHVAPSLALTGTERDLVHGGSAEAFAFVVEALYFTFLGRRRTFRWSLAANAVSAGVGIVLTLLIGWP